MDRLRLAYPRWADMSSLVNWITGSSKVRARIEHSDSSFQFRDAISTQPA
jgi:hypothetical protein